jgi:Zn-dependent M28 family amino/carboxypeptidase
MATLSPRRRLPPGPVDAPLVFVGYGLHMPSAGHDDFAGVDLQGKIAVFVSGGPANVPGSLKSHARAQRGRFLMERGAIGAISVTTPGQAEAGWETAVRNSTQPGMFLADPAAGGDARPFVELSWNPAEAQRLFAGSSRSFGDVAADADASRPLGGFAMAARLKGRFSATAAPVSSPNVVARLRGSDPALAAEHVVMTAHLDGLGIGRPVNGDSINNGALDNAAGVAALLDMAEQLKARHC